MAFGNSHERDRMRRDRDLSAREHSPEWYQPEAGQPSGTTASGMAGRYRLDRGMEVIGADGKRVGEVIEVREDAFLVDRALQRDVLIPFQAITDVIDYRVMLTVASDQIDEMDWEKPAVFRPGSDSLPNV